MNRVVRQSGAGVLHTLAEHFEELRADFDGEEIRLRMRASIAGRASVINHPMPRVLTAILRITGPASL
jgi:hypothetical protein